jgi:hypothetical protein
MLSPAVVWEREMRASAELIESDVSRALIAF